jgi:hypothetical protein
VLCLPAAIGQKGFSRQYNSRDSTTQGHRNDLIASTDSNNPNWRSANTNNSVQCNHRHDGDRCHSRVDQVSILDLGSANMNNSVQYNHHHDGDSCHVCVDQVTSANSGGNVVAEQSVHPTSWVHVAKSNKPSSIRTQAAAIAYFGKQLHSKAKHRRNRRAKKKIHKQQILLREVIVPPTSSIHQNMLSQYDVLNKIVVVDGGDTGNPQIRPPDGVNWRRQ